VFGLTRSALSDEFNFRVSCVLFDMVLMCGVSREIYKRRFCLSDLRSFVRLVRKLCGANIYFCTVEHRCVRVDSLFIAKSVLANLASGEAETAAR